MTHTRSKRLLAGTLAVLACTAFSSALTLAATPAAAAAGSARGAFADAAPERLAEYIHINTTHPPGNESAGVEFFARIFDEAGIAYQTAESAPGRGNIWARLEGRGNAPALVLLSHIDVVGADPRYWSVDPFAGTIRDGYVWGRGALDMKGTGIAQLQAFLALHASGKRLARDVVFVATADEEAGGAYGAGWLVENHPEIFAGAGFLLNEGGSGTILGGDTVFTVEVTQKVPLWLRLTAHGRPGHGSTPQAATAVTRILRAGDRLANTSFAARLIPPVQSMFEGMAPYAGDELGPRFANIGNAVQDDEFLRYLQLTEPRMHALLRNTCSITRLAGSDKINVVPTEASMELDCRLLPDQNPDQFIAELATIVNDPNVGIEQIMGFTPAMSSTDSPLYQLIEALIHERMPGAQVIPGVSTGFTDSHFFRDLGIASYGFGAFVVPPEDGRSVHGNNERISVENMRAGTAFTIELVERFATR
ncbi:MAG: M20/M25/M40 family metallo-hydrolase [Pseudomonadales bacterium]